MNEYNPKDIEPKWQGTWDKEGFYYADNFTGGADKKKWYTLVEFPYPSGAGLHVGHVRSYTALDIVSRKKRMEGFNVLYPMGWDAFGLPTENYAIKHKIHPRQATNDNIANFKRQIQSLGLSFDWKREIDTTDPDYYKWTQWIFLQLFKKDLAYQDEIPINWCPSCKIGLANEEVVDGKCERCGTETTKKVRKQWMLKITEYAQRLIDDLETVDYLPQISTQQINWIGRSDGINITYDVADTDKQVTVFTTRPDTNFGATFIALAPDGSFVREHLDSFPEKDNVEQYVHEAIKKTDIERAAEGRKKTGMFTGLYATNPLTKLKMPMYVADFVLGQVGTGSLVGVPGHDARDFEFASEMNKMASGIEIDVIRVVIGPDGDESEITSIEQVQEKVGVMINSEFLDGLKIKDATEKMMDYMEAEEQGWGKRVINYKLRDWVFSRQRYWGEPIPIIHCESCGAVPVPENQLPVELPDVEKYEPTASGESPLAVITDWVNVKCPECAGPAKRETDTMPNWAGSSWYYLRYTDANNDQEFAAASKLAYWTPVDLYSGGMEHTTLHLLYSRFWHKFLFDIGVVPTAEPYASRRAHGMILADDGKKMSKSLGNVVNPDEIVEQYGADTLRIYEMFMGPFDEAISWDENGVKGANKFIERVWRLQDMVSTEADSRSNDSSSAEDAVLEKTVKKVTEDVNAMKFNTAVAQLMICVNHFYKQKSISQQVYDKFLTVFSLFAPHMAEELWELAGHNASITQEAWPSWNEDLVIDDTITMAVQVNGKVRGDVELAVDAVEDVARAAALEVENVKKYTAGKDVVKFIYVPGRIINIVVK